MQASSALSKPGAVNFVGTSHRRSLCSLVKGASPLCISRQAALQSCKTGLPHRSSTALQASHGAERCRRMLVRAEPAEERKVTYNTEFGYSRKDVLIIIVALIAVGVLMYEGLQATGMSAGMAGNWVQLIIFLGICVGWVSTYLYRVANKKMTYAQQLRMYEEAVMQKRLDEMTEAELQQLLQEVDQDKEKQQATLAALRKQQAGKQQ